MGSAATSKHQKTSATSVLTSGVRANRGGDGLSLVGVNKITEEMRGAIAHTLNSAGLEFSGTSYCRTDFEFLDMLGQGSYGRVHRVRRRSDGCIFVLKQIDVRGLSQKEKVLCVNEVQVMVSSQQPAAAGAEVGGGPMGSVMDSSTACKHLVQCHSAFMEG